MTWSITSNSLNHEQLLNEESLFFTGNGYLGIRGNFEEGYDQNRKSIRGSYLNAFYDDVEITYGEKLHAFPDTQQKLLNVMDTQSIHIFLGNGSEREVFSLFTGEILAYERALHLDRGLAQRTIHWRSPLGKEVKLTFKRLVSFVHKEVFCQQVTIDPVTFTGHVTIVSTVTGDVTNYVNADDPRVASGHAKRLHVIAKEQRKNASLIEVETYHSKLKSASHTSCTVSLPSEKEQFEEGHKLETHFHFSLEKKVMFEKKSIFVDTIRHGQKLLPLLEVKANQLEDQDFSTLLEKQVNYLQSYWNHADVAIQGDEQLQEGIRFNLFQLLQSVGKDRYSNIAAKGLSGEGYEGHYFWDTEIYMFPVFLLTNPELAKNLLLYRYHILDAARDRAKEMGHKQGALFPWRTISGTECSAYYPAGTAQYHISGDVAYSYIQYYLATKDLEFMERYGAEVLFETARLWLEVGHFHQGNFRIDAVTGPDEYTCIVNNNYYTNLLAQHNLKWAVTIFDMMSKEKAVSQLCERLSLSAEEVFQWRQAAELMYLPFDEERKINPQDDTFLQKKKWDFDSTPQDNYPLLLHYHPLTLYRYQVCKQADTVLAHFLLEDAQDQEVLHRSYDYYENITTHDSSLSSCIFSIMASKVGYHDKAYRYFEETARLDLDNTHGNTKDGLHMANMGGTWLAIVQGFGGLRVKESGLSLAPSLPENWTSYAFSIVFQNRHLHFEVRDDQVNATLVSGDPLTIMLHGEKLDLM
ncbi:glycoside hydrolase family 65 protein [Bacillus sp. 2205SS5-2]|uniref:glycoside hydrolase family 65 protein n=1 Tax=Bacillus sp. 2205SS5-2 TaxID=3109031 RepID=UPI003007AF23